MPRKKRNHQELRDLGSSLTTCYSVALGKFLWTKLPWVHLDTKSEISPSAGIEGEEHSLVRDLSVNWLRLEGVGIVPLWFRT